MTKEKIARLRKLLREEGWNVAPHDMVVASKLVADGSSYGVVIDGGMVRLRQSHLQIVTLLPGDPEVTAQLFHTILQALGIPYRRDGAVLIGDPDERGVRTVISFVDGAYSLSRAADVRSYPLDVDPEALVGDVRHIVAEMIEDDIVAEREDEVANWVVAWDPPS